MSCPPKLTELLCLYTRTVHYAEISMTDQLAVDVFCSKFIVARYPDFMDSSKS